ASNTSLFSDKFKRILTQSKSVIPDSAKRARTVNCLRYATLNFIAAGIYLFTCCQRSIRYHINTIIDDVSKLLPVTRSHEADFFPYKLVNCPTKFHSEVYREMVTADVIAHVTVVQEAGHVACDNK